MRKVAVLLGCGVALVVAAGPVLAESRSSEPRTTGVKVYADAFEAAPYTRVTYGYDVSAVCTDNPAVPCSHDDDCNGVCGVLVDALTPGTQVTIWDLVCDPDPTTEVCRATAWDFSGVRATQFTVSETASSAVPVSSSATCSSEQCGFNRKNLVPPVPIQLGREDRNWNRLSMLCDDNTTPCTGPADCAGIGDGSCNRAGTCDDGTTRCVSDAACSGIGSGRCEGISMTLNAVEREDRASDVTLWLRAVVRKEGETGSLGTGESRLCYDPDSGRTPVALWRFPHNDGDGRGWYMQVGDSWPDPGDPAEDFFDCEQNIFNHVCPNSCGVLVCQVRTAPGTGNCGIGPDQALSGTQSSEVVHEGAVTLPSGHTFDALVVRSTAEFCAGSSFLDPNCNQCQSPVRTVIYLWEVPHLGTVARLMSVQFACDETSFEVLAETDIKFGLFPPRSIGVTAVDDTSISLSWDPGSITDRIGSAGGDYRVYWDTDSGLVSDYANNVVVSGTSTTIGGLDPGTEYFFTVTALSDFTDPGPCVRNGACDPPVTYESIRFPNQIPGSPAPMPAEVSATTTGGACTPTVEVTGVLVDKVAGGIEICWDAVADPCVDGYRILGADTPESAGNYSAVVPDTGLTTCHTFDPTQTYFIVVGKGTGGQGPTGHFGM